MLVYVLLVRVCEPFDVDVQCTVTALTKDFFFWLHQPGQKRGPACFLRAGRVDSLVYCEGSNSQ